MQIDIHHWDYLRITAAGCAAFDSENGSQTRFTQNGNCFFTYFI